MLNISIRSIGITTFVLFLLHGQLSAAIPFLQPFQIPLAALAAACAGMLVFPLRRSMFVALAITLIAVYFIVTAPAVSVMTSYSDSKPNNMLLTIGFTLLLPPLLIRNRNDLQRLLNTLGTVALLVTLFAIIGGNLSLQGRLILGEEGNPIWLGRAAGLALLWITWRVLTMQTKPYLLLFFLTSLFVLIATGSRGPLLASLIGLISLVITTRPKISNLAGGLGLLLATFLVSIMFRMPIEGFSQAYTRGEDVTSGRSDLVNTSWLFIKDNPYGIGVGGLDAWIPPHYPHNIIVEALAELGWFPGILLAASLLSVLWRYGRISRLTPEAAMLFAFTIYSLLNSLVSGDLTSPKELYLLCSMSLVAPLILAE